MKVVGSDPESELTAGRGAMMDDVPGRREDQRVPGIRFPLAVDQACHGDAQSDGCDDAVVELTSIDDGVGSELVVRHERIPEAEPVHRQRETLAVLDAVEAQVDALRVAEHRLGLVGIGGRDDRKGLEGHRIAAPSGHRRHSPDRLPHAPNPSFVLPFRQARG